MTCISFEMKHENPTRETGALGRKGRVLMYLDMELKGLLSMKLGPVASLSLLGWQKNAAALSKAYIAW